MIRGNLQQFSLPEILRMIEQGNKTGLLCLTSIETKKGSRKLEKKNHYIWFRDGEITAAANRLNGQNLISIINRRSWIKQDKISLFEEVLKSAKMSMSLGEHLLALNILQLEDLQRLFNLQVLREMIPLFQLKKADFIFYKNVSAPLTEVTGIRITVKELLLKSLRVLPNWDALKDKLPMADSTLQLNSNSFHINISSLNNYEEKVVEIAKKQFSLREIARQLYLTLEKIQQIAFRLIMAGYAEEIPLINANNQENSLTQPLNQSQISKHYLNQLISFLDPQPDQSVEVLCGVSANH